MGALRRAPDNDDLVALGAQLAGGCGADAIAGTGDDDDLRFGHVDS
jgi:hypothetical protein